MNVLLAIGGVALASAVVLCCAALIELFRQLADVRTVLNLRDSATPLDLKTGEIRTDEVGLPRELALEPQAIVVALSPKCATCLAIAGAFREGAPATVWFMMPSLPRPVALLEMLAKSTDRIVLDENDEIAQRIGLHVTPSVLSVSYGEITRAHGVSSASQVQPLIPALLPRNRTALSSAEPQARLEGIAS